MRPIKLIMLGYYLDQTVISIKVHLAFLKHDIYFLQSSNRDIKS